MTEHRLSNLALMAIYPERLSALTNKAIIIAFHRDKNRRNMKTILNIEGSNCFLLRNFGFLILSLFLFFGANQTLHVDFVLCPAIRIFVRCDRWLFLLK